jgi:ATP-dependent DNA helicase RecG
MGGRELSPHDIYRAMNTQDRDTYDKEVTYLRNTGILVETRTPTQAYQKAKQTGNPKRTIPRFKAIVPK